MDYGVLSQKYEEAWEALDLLESELHKNAHDAKDGCKEYLEQAEGITSRLMNELRDSVMEYINHARTEWLKEQNKEV